MSRLFLLSIILMGFMLASSKPFKSSSSLNIPVPSKSSLVKVETPSKKIRDIDIDNFGTEAANYPDIVQGDIRVTKEQLKEKNGRSLVPTGVNQWPGGVIPYVFTPYNGRTHTDSEKATVRLSMDMITTKTNGCIKFVPRTTETSYLNIINDNGCWSYLGRINGAQSLSLQQTSTGTCMSKGTIVHELMHAIGVMHEQARMDRDTYVTVNYNNIDPSRYNNFNKMNGSYHQTNYDYYSIMHYTAYAFSINGEPTIVPVDPTVVLLHSSQKTDAQIMTDSDISAVQSFYQCAALNVNTTTTTTTTTTTLTTTTSAQKIAFNFRIKNQYSNYAIQIYERDGDYLYLMGSLRAGRTSASIATFVGVEWWVFTSDQKFYSYNTAGSGLLAKIGVTVGTSSMQWYTQ